LAVGNVDCKELVAGSTLYLPVDVPADAVEHQRVQGVDAGEQRPGSDDGGAAAGIAQWVSPVSRDDLVAISRRRYIGLLRA
jgi:hypothetical protein